MAIDSHCYVRAIEPKIFTTSSKQRAFYQSMALCFDFQLHKCVIERMCECSIIFMGPRNTNVDMLNTHESIKSKLIQFLESFINTQNRVACKSSIYSLLLLQLACIVPVAR